MTPRFDSSGSVWYLLLEDRPVARTVELHPNLILDLDADNRLVGIEGLGPVQFPEDSIITMSNVRLNHHWSEFKSKEQK